MIQDPSRTTDHPSKSLEVQLFHERLLKLPENIFLEVARNYLGDLQTPFNKHEILQRLESFLRGPELHTRVQAFLSLRERRILTVLRMLGAATEETLFSFLGSDYSRLDFHLKLLNLEDRLLVFRDPDSALTMEFRLVPHFVATLEPLLDRNLLVPSSRAETRVGPRFGLDHLIAAALASLDGTTLPVNRKGEFRKRERTELLKRFGPLLTSRNLDEASSDRFLHTLIRGLHHLGLLSVQGGKLWTSRERLGEFAGLGRRQRQVLFCAAALYPEPENLRRNPEDDNPEYFGLGRVHAFGVAQETFLALFDPEEIYEHAALATLKALAGTFPCPVDFSLWLQGLADLDRLVPHSSGWQSVSHDENPATAQARVEGNFQVSILGHPDLFDLVPLLESCTLEAFGESSRWMIQKERFQDALARGTSLEGMKKSLESLRAGALPPNVAFSLQSWAEDQSSLDFLDGVLVCARGQRQALLDMLPGLTPYVLARPAPGMVLLDRSAQAEWIKVLKEAELSTSAWENRSNRHAMVLPEFRSLDLKTLDDLPFQAASLAFMNKVSSRTNPGALSAPTEGLITSDPTAQVTAQAPVSSPAPTPQAQDSAHPKPQARENDGQIPAVPSTAPSVEPTAPVAPAPPVDDSAAPSNPDTTLTRPGIIKELLALVEAMVLTDEVRDEMRQRIREGLFLFPQQIQPDALRVERMEAGGLDFQGKKRVIDQVIKSRRDFLELHLIGSGDTDEGMTVLPIQLKLTGTEHLLVAHTVPEGRELSFMVRKILRLKRVRSGFFF